MNRSVARNESFTWPAEPFRWPTESFGRNPGSSGVRSESFPPQ